MSRGPRLSKAQRDELWCRWRAGESGRSIARALRVSPAAVRYVVAPTGGISPRVRHRATTALTLEERETISRSLAAGASLRSIARVLGRCASTVSREVARNGGRAGYRAVRADQRALDAARRPKTCKLARHGWLRKQVARRLRQGWTPQQIAGWLARSFPDDDTRRVSHETIYVSLYVQARGVLRKELAQQLKSGRTARRARTATGKGQGRGQIPDAVPISERPPEAADRAVPGHWEGDLIEGSNNTFVATLVERRSRFIMLVKVPSKKTGDVVPAVARKIKGLPTELKATVTWDRGREMTRHVDFTVATGVQVYFADPQSPWQRPTNENSNKLIREYLPKGTDLSAHSQRQLDAIARKLNARPRKVLDYATPAATLATVLP
jgi:IS30 family transposase